MRRGAHRRRGVALHEFLHLDLGLSCLLVLRSSLRLHHVLPTLRERLHRRALSWVLFAAIPLRGIAAVRVRSERHCQRGIAPFAVPMRERLVGA